jgi:hypothetical protein
VPAGGRGRSPKPSYLRPRPASVATVAAQLPPTAWRTVRWRDGTQGPLESRFAALRIQPRTEYRTDAFQQPVGSQLIKCRLEAAPTNYSLANLAAPMSLHRLVRWAKSPCGSTRTTDRPRGSSSSITTRAGVCSTIITTSPWSWWPTASSCYNTSAPNKNLSMDVPADAGHPPTSAGHADRRLPYLRPVGLGALNRFINS